VTAHNAISDVLFTAAQSAALSPSKETPSLVPNPMTRPADVYLPNWSRGRPAVLDVQHVMERAAAAAGHALHIGVQQSWSLTCPPVGMCVVPYGFIDFHPPPNH
jgi:hypothetical protein